MSNAVANISAALGYDAVEAMLAGGHSLAACYAFATVSLDMLATEELAPESAKTVLAVDSVTVRPGR